MSSKCLENRPVSNEASNNNDSVPELPGFYYDHEKQKYFKIGSNSFGVASAITNYSIAKKREQEDLSVKNKSFAKNLVNLLSMSELHGISSVLKNNHKDYIMHTSKARKLLDISTYPKFKELQAFQVESDTYFLVNFSEDSVNYINCVFKVGSVELDKIRQVNNSKILDFVSIIIRILEK